MRVSHALDGLTTKHSCPAQLLLLFVVAAAATSEPLVLQADASTGEQPCEEGKKLANAGQLDAAWRTLLSQGYSIEAALAKPGTAD